MTIRKCIEFAHDMGVLDEVDYLDLILELESLIEDREALTNLKLYGEEDYNGDEDN